MKYSLGLTAVTLIAVSGLYLAGCADSTAGMGIIDPFDPTSPTPYPTSTSTITPSPDPTAKQTEVFVDNITNPIAVERLISKVNTSDTYGELDNYWVLQQDRTGGDSETGLLRIAADTKKGKSDTDRNSPRKIKLIDIDDGKEIHLHLASCLKYVPNAKVTLSSGASSKYQKVYGPGYNGDEGGGKYLVISDNVDKAEGRIIVANPNEIEGKDGEIQAHVIMSTCKRPVAISADSKYIWWAECKEDGRVFRLDFTDEPDKVDGEKDAQLYIQGTNFPLNLDTSGEFFCMADTKKNCVLVALKNRGEKEPPAKDKAVYQSYGYNETDKIYVLSYTGGMRQPYALKVLSNGKLLIADNSYNPFFSGITGIESTGEGTGRLLVWNRPCGEEARSEKLGTDVNLICEGLTNPMEICPTYDSSADYTNGRYAQLVDVLIPQYDEGNATSKIALKRANISWNYHKVRMQDDKDIIKPTRCSWVSLLAGLPIISTSADQKNPPKEQDVELRMLYNEKVNSDTNNASKITKYEDKYPF